LIDANAREAPLAVFGGTFNPVHYGHLRSALELVERLGLAELRLMPSARPPHREEPGCSAQHRLAMVELAVAGEPRLTCDGRELERSGKSFTIDSLIELREEAGESRGLCMVIGCDALLGIPTWRRWRELLDWAHIIVIARPGWTLPETGEVAQWLEEHRLADSAELGSRPSGGICVEKLRPLDISSTEIRDILSTGRSPRYLMPQPVIDYMEQHALYQ